MTYQAKHEYQAAMASFCESLRCDYFVTLASNLDDFPLGRAEDHLGHIDAVLNRRWLGCYWTSKPADQRSLLLAFPEMGHMRAPTGTLPLHCGEYSHPGLGSLHYHLLMRVPPNPRNPLNRDEIADIILHEWKRLVPSGSISVSLLTCDEQRRRTSSYCIKEFTQTGFGIEHWLLLPRRCRERS